MNTPSVLAVQFSDLLPGSPSSTEPHHYQRDGRSVSDAGDEWRIGHRRHYVPGHGHGAMRNRGKEGDRVPARCLRGHSNPSGCANYLAATSAPTTVTFSFPARPGLLTVRSKPKSTSLTASARAALARLGHRLFPGATVEIIAYGPLAARRSKVVKSYLDRRPVHIKLILSAKRSTNSVIVRTISQ